MTSVTVSPAAVEFLDGDIPYSSQFQDVYFSRAGGVDESSYVYLNGNGLPERFADFPGTDFQLLETGFGTGLNFLLTAQAFLAHAPKGKCLRYFSIEGFPLTAVDLQRALQGFTSLRELSQPLCEQYPPLLRNWHTLRFANGRIELILVFDEVNTVLPQLLKSQWRFDAFYLDGFAPARNPEMWQSEWLIRLNKLARPQATLASFTAVGEVRRQLQQAGFDIERRKGFGHKREMIVGRFPHSPRPRPSPSLDKREPVLIVGNGIAGCALAYQLNKLDFPVIVAASSAVGGTLAEHDCAVAGPRWSKDFDRRSRWYLNGFLQLQAFVAQQAPVTLLSKGVIDLISDEEWAETLERLQHLGLHHHHTEVIDENLLRQWVGAESRLHGVLQHLAMTVAPQRLCQHLLADNKIEQRQAPLNHYQYDEHGVQVEWQDGKLERFAAVIFCTGSDSPNWFPELPMSRVRGQYNLVPATEQSRELKQSLRFGGYLCPAIENRHILGASFEHDAVGLELDAPIHRANWRKLHKRVPSLAAPWRSTPMQGQVGFRLMTPDRLPIVGAHPKQARVYLNFAHGAHGLMSAFSSAELLAAQLSNRVPALPPALIKAVSPLRFLNP